ncbi:MAG: GtrA family protein [Burkholderiales bacterium]|nr:GtrA family protein [Burkholderiales bacterium]
MIKAHLHGNRTSAQLLRFVVAGLLVAGVDAALFMLLWRLGVPRGVANVAAMSAGFALGLLLHRRFTFRIERAIDWTMLRNYALVFAFNLLLGTASLIAAMSIGAPALAAKLLSMAIVVLSNFVLSRRFVFTSSVARRPE